MSLLIALVVGIIIGVIGGFLMRDEYDTLFMNILAGIVGSVLGLGAYVLLLGGLDGSGYFSGRSIICSVIGAVIIVSIFDLLHKVATKLPSTDR